MEQQQPDNRSTVWRRTGPSRRPDEDSTNPPPAPPTIPIPADPSATRSANSADSAAVIPFSELAAMAAQILFSHPPRHVARWVCACGEEYPCGSVRWALRVNAAALAAAEQPPPPARVRQ